MGAGAGVGVGVGGGEGAAPEPRLFLLVEVQPHSRELTLRLYEALEARRSPTPSSDKDEVRALIYNVTAVVIHGETPIGQKLPSGLLSWVMGGGGSRAIFVIGVFQYQNIKGFLEKRWPDRKPVGACIRHPRPKGL